MEQRRTGTERWLETASAGIRFKPDRAAVERELREHIEDKRADLQRLYPDMAPEEAEERALSQMGDAAEIGRELAKLHRPWLGYLWRMSQAVLGAALLIAVIVGANCMLAGYKGWFVWGEGLDLTRGDCIGALEPAPERARVDGCTISMEQAALYASGGEAQLVVVVRAASPYFWIQEGQWYQFVSAVDSLGNYYFTQYERFEEHSASSWQYVHGVLDGYSPFYKDYILWVEELDPAAEWIRLEYDWLGRQFAMTVELKGAEE